MRRRVGPREGEAGHSQAEPPADDIPAAAHIPEKPQSPPSTPSTPEKAGRSRTWMEWGDEECPARFCCCDCCGCCQGTPRRVIYGWIALGFLMTLLGLSLLLIPLLTSLPAGIPEPAKGNSDRRRLLVVKQAAGVSLESPGVINHSLPSEYNGSQHPPDHQTPLSKAAEEVGQDAVGAEPIHTNHALTSAQGKMAFRGKGQWVEDGPITRLEDDSTGTASVKPVTVLYNGSNVTVGYLVPAKAVEAAEKAGRETLQRRQDELLAREAAAAAGETGMGPTLAEEMLADMLSADSGRGRALQEEDQEGEAQSCLDPNSFRRAVKGRTLLLVMHEASLTGAPLAVAELGAQAVACGASRVQVVLLNWQKQKPGGGDALTGQRKMLKGLKERGVEVLKGKGTESWGAADASHAVVLGSATCAPWLDGLLRAYPGAAAKVVWWVMENRRRYFHIAQPLLPKVAAAVFLSQHQAQAWHTWSLPGGGNKSSGLETKEHSSTGASSDEIMLTSLPRLPDCRLVVPLTLSPDLTPLSGLTVKHCPSHPSPRPDKPLASSPGPGVGTGGEGTGTGPLRSGCWKVQAARAAAAEAARAEMRARVRATMGLVEGDMLVICLSSINPGKGQLGLLRAGINAWQVLGAGDGTPREQEKDSVHAKNKSGTTGNTRGRLVLAVGSVGCKANKAEYLSLMHTTVAEAVSRSPAVAHQLGGGGLLWVESTMHVAALYAAADAYVMNAQGMGETFGRVSVEAMAFGVPVLGTAAGGTLDIVVQNRTGLMHPVGKLGDEKLTVNMLALLQDPQLRGRLGGASRERVRRKFMGAHMYKALGRVLGFVIEDGGESEGGHTKLTCSSSSSTRQVSSDEREE